MGANALVAAFCAVPRCGIIGGMKVSVSCGQCGRSFMAHDREVARGRGKYCSRPCATRAIHTGLPKPKSRENMRKLGLASKGRRPSNAKEPVLKPCEACGVSMAVKPSLAKRKRFCSAACKHAKRRTVTGPDHWLFTRTPRTCEMCGATVLVKACHQERFRFCSLRCAGSWVSNTWPRTSSIERALHEELRLRGLAFDIEYAIGPYTVDIAFPSGRVVIEADGAYWHGTERQQAKDRRKDAYLRNHGWTVIRLTEAAIKESPAACIDTIMLIALDPERLSGVKIPSNSSGDPARVAPDLA